MVQKELSFVRVVVLKDAESNLAHVGLTLNAGRRTAHLLDGRQQEADQRADDGDDYQQLNVSVQSTQGSTSVP
jgi:hypothetical protein